MRNSKIVATIAAAALLVLGLAFTSMAANKWTYVDGQWVAVNNDGDEVGEKWVKGDDGVEYYADEDGVWACDTWTYDEDGDKAYYAGSDGKKVKGWLKIEETDEDDDDYGELFWYHFDESTGKVTTTGVKTVNGKKYVFDDNFRMLTGWVADIDETTTGTEWASLDLTDEDDWDLFDDVVYYCGTEDEGWAYSKWHELEGASCEDGAEAGDVYTYWFYFGANNKIYKSDKDEDDDTVYQKTIEGEKYTFDRCGRMLTGFVPSVATATDYIWMGTPASASYINDNGTVLTKGWIWAKPVSYTSLVQQRYDSSFDEDGEHWFWGNKSGKIVVNQFTTAKTTSTYWALDKTGIMLSGLYEIPVAVKTEKAPTKAVTGDLPFYAQAVGSLTADDTVATTADANSYYFYFGEEKEDGAMKTGVQTVTIDGTEVEMRFYKKNEVYWKAVSGSTVATKSTIVTLGHAVRGYNKNGKYYVDGQVQCGDADNYVSFAPIAATASSANNGKVDVCVPSKSSTWLTSISHGTATSTANEEDGIYPIGGSYCLVKKDGTIVKNSSTGVKDADGNKYYVKDFVIYQVKLAD